MNNTEQIILKFEEAYRDFHCKFHRDRDPVYFVHQYVNKKDQEIVAFLAALLAYGNVKSILRIVSGVTARLGKSPYQTVIDRKFYGQLLDLKHRFTTGSDLEVVCEWLSSTLRSHGSIENAFLDAASASLQMKDKISSFVEGLEAIKLPSHLAHKREERAQSLKYLVTSPTRGSACKRMNLFLRWMVRSEDGIDLGLWKGIRPSMLMLPVDTHILKTIKQLRWTKSSTASWKVVESATEKLRLLNPEDPIRYDFALCHLSMTGKSLEINREEEVGCNEKLERRSIHKAGKEGKLRSALDL